MRYHVLLLTFFTMGLYASTTNITVDQTATQTLRIIISVVVNDTLLFPKIIQGTLPSVTSEDSGIAGSVGHNASLTTTGSPSLTYTVLGVDSMTLTSGGNTINVTLAFKTGTANRTLDGSGSDTFQIVGTANVSGKPNGTYTGTRDVNVAYN
ncbi:MAG: DUF4402 domain-containing protein [Pseudomonadota bacterium]